MPASHTRGATYDALLRQVWSGRSHANPQLVRAYVQRLRRKLGDDTSQPWRGKIARAAQSRVG